MPSAAAAAFALFWLATIASLATVWVICGYFRGRPIVFPCALALA